VIGRDDRTCVVGVARREPCLLLSICMNLECGTHLLLGELASRKSSPVDSMEDTCICVEYTPVRVRYGGVAW